MSTTIDTLLRRDAAAYPNRAAVVDGPRTLTYRELDAEVEALAVALVQLGLRKGDRIAIMFPNELAFLVSYFAGARTGAVVVPINHRLVTDEIGFQVDHAECRFFLYSAAFEPAVAPLRSSTAVEHWISTVAAVGVLGMADLIETHAAQWLRLEWTVGQDDPGGIWYTSGTTGKPKGALTTHGSSIWSAVGMATTVALSSTSRILATAPLFHRGPMETLQLAGFLVGATHYLMPRFDPTELLRKIEQHRITHAFVVPAMTFAVLGVPNRGDFDLTSVECWLTASAPFPEEYRDRLEAETSLPPGRVFNGYGITESLLNTLLRPDHAASHRGSVGQAVPGSELDVVDASGASLEPGAVGEVVACANSIAAGYTSNPEAWQAVTYELRGRTWYRTGDLGYLDAEGFLYLVDRSKDMLISGGENVYSAELELVLQSHPDIDQVAIVGTPHEQWGECVTAVVVPSVRRDLTLSDLVRFCEGRLAGYKHPRRLVIVDELPRNAFGKVVKTAVREIALAGLD